MPDDDGLLAQGTVDARREERLAANRGPRDVGAGDLAESADEPDGREALVAAALQRFWGGDADDGLGS